MRKHIKYTQYQSRLISILLISISFFSCRNELEPQMLPGEGINIKIGDVSLLRSEDIDYYDESSHLFYLKKNFSYSFEKYCRSAFWVTENNDVLFSGTFFYSLSSCCCFDDEPVVYMHFDYDNYPMYTLQISYCRNMTQAYFDYTDLRDGEEFLSGLEENGKLRKGLDCEIDDVERLSETEVDITFKVTNNDSINYYIPDPEKMSLENYHGLTCGLYLVDSTNTRFWNNATQNGLGNYDDWKDKWLSLIKSGETKYFSVDYPNFDTIVPGNYIAFFKLPGLKSQVPVHDSVFQEEGHLWLGECELAKRVELY